MFQVWTLVGIFIAIALSAILISIVAVDHLPRHLLKRTDSSVKEEFKTLMTSTLRQSIKRKQMLLIPLTVYSGLAQSYFAAEYNRVRHRYINIFLFKQFPNDFLKLLFWNFQSWVTCALGIDKIGLINIPFGLMGAIVSFSGGRLVKYIGRLPILITGNRHSINKKKIIQILPGLSVKSL